MKERITYRGWKWLVQKVSLKRNTNQLTNLRTIDWDILIILDACRADVLQNITDWPINITTSPASCTSRWLQSIAADGVFNDTHIISGNPQYEKVDVEFNCENIEAFWDSHWDTKLQTTLPEPILDRVDDVISDTHHKMVAHLQQPHWPYVAKLGNEWMLAHNNLGPWRHNGEEIHSMQVAMQRGLINVDEAKKGYRASVRSVWEVLSEYLSRWVNNGYTVVVTADHGETFGRFHDFGFYEHPCGCHLGPLINVPWVELKPRSEGKAINNVEEKLRALGYAE